MALIFIVATFIALSMLTETVGIWARVIGSFNDKPTTGYSTHVRVATLGRFFTFLAAPMLGYLVDTGITPQSIALLGLIAFIIVFIVILVFLKIGIPYFIIIYKALNRRNIDLNITNVIPDYKLFSFKRGFFTLCFLSFSFVASGLIAVNYIAATHPESRAMIVQMSAIITVFGTLLHVFLIDPSLANAGDSDKHKLLNLTLNFLVARTIASFTLIVLLLFTYLYA